MDIKINLLESLNYALRTGSLSVEQKRGILTLIPKKEKNRLFLKKWRPLTLLNLDYKILSKVFASRITKFLPIIVDEDQTGYIKGRFVGCNIRLIEDIVMYTNKHNIPGILLAIDFEKAFDSLSWSFIENTLESFNFGPLFRSAIKTLYNDVSTTVINNGYTSDWFFPKRGVRQGCPISPYLFILAVEVLACNIRNDEIIKGIKIGDKEIKMCQLADDTTSFVQDAISLKNLLVTLNKFKFISGLGINVDKTIAYGLGPFIPGSNNPYGLDWSKKQIDTLGVTITGREDDHYLLNFKKRLKNMQNLLNTWKCRHLSLKGKITVINTLALPSLIYLASVIHVPRLVYKEVKSLVLNFLWDGGTAKIAYNVLIQGIDHGGLKLTDFECKVKALKASWVKRFCDGSDVNWKAAPSVFYGTKDINFYFKCNLGQRKDIDSRFYTDCHNFWCSLNNINPEDGCSIRNQVLWNNQYITIQNKPFIWDQWVKHGIIRVGNLINSVGMFLDSKEIYNKFGLKCNFLNILQLRQSLPGQWRRVLSASSDTKVFDKDTTVVFLKDKTIPLYKCETKVFYWSFICQQSVIPTAFSSWNRIFNYSLEDWADISRRPFKIVRDTKTQSFQYRVIHRTITCNKKLHEMKIKNSPICNYCASTDDICHFFVHCQDVKLFWEALFDWFNSLQQTEFHFPGDNIILFGYPMDGDLYQVINYFILQAKVYIHKQRLFKNNELSMSEFKRILKYSLEIERICCQGKSGNFDKFEFAYSEL